jgi:hypothetical protein
MFIKKVKKRINVVEGFISYPMTIDPVTHSIICPCDKKICKHIIFFLESKGFDIKLLEHWNRIKNHLIQGIGENQIDNDKLWETVNQEIESMHCGFCLNHINVNHQYHVCSDCHGITHVACHRKWASVGNGCMLCRSSS